MRPSNLVAAPFLEGQRVCLTGLVGRAELNGQFGTLRLFKAETGRWAVALEGSSKESVNVRDVNLRAAPAPRNKRKGDTDTKAPAPPGKGKIKLGTKQATKEPQQRTKQPSAGVKPAAGKVHKPALKGKFAARGSLKVKSALRKAKANTEAGGSKVKSSSALQAKQGRGLRGKVKKAMIKQSKQVPLKPKKAPSAYLLFCNKHRELVMAELRKKFGSSELPDIARELGERWGDLDEKEKRKYEKMAAKRKETHQAKMQAYQARVDPVGAFKKKHAHLIPKRPTTPYFLFGAEPEQRRKASEELGGGAGEARIAAKLAEMWRALPESEKEPYVRQFQEEKAAFEEKTTIWQRSKHYQELEKLLEAQRAAQKADRQKRKDDEEAEMQALIDQGGAPGLGLAADRHAIVVGLQSREDLNGKEVCLIEEVHGEPPRWTVKLLDAETGETLNLKPENLFLSRLHKHAHDMEKREQDKANRAEIREVKMAAQAEHRAERAAERAEKRAAERAERDAEKAEQAAAKADALAAEKAAQLAQREKDKAAKAAEHEASLAAKLEEREAVKRAKLEQREKEKAEKYAREAELAEKIEIEKLAKAARKHAEREAQKAAKLAQQEAEREARWKMQAAAKAAADAMEEAKKAMREMAEKEGPPGC